MRSNQLVLLHGITTPSNDLDSPLLLGNQEPASAKEDGGAEPATMTDNEKGSGSAAPSPAEHGGKDETQHWGSAGEGMPSVTLKLAMDRNGAVDDMSEGPKRFTSQASLDAGDKSRESRVAYRLSPFSS